MTSLQSPFSFSFPNSYTTNDNTHKLNSSSPNASYLPTPSSSKAQNNINTNDTINIHNANDNDNNDIENSTIDTTTNINNYDLLIGKLNIMKSKLNKLDANNIVGELKQLIEESYQLIKNSDTLNNENINNSDHTNNSNNNHIDNGFTFTPVRNNNSYDNDNQQQHRDGTMNYYTPPPSSTNDDILYQTPLNKIINNDNLFKRQRYNNDDDIIDWSKDDLDHFKYVTNDHIQDLMFSTTTTTSTNALGTSNSMDNYTTDSNLEHQFEINFELN